MKRILVVDDDEVQVKLLQGILSERGYEVLTSHEAAEGLQKAINDAPDLIILDVMMPIINGYNFCKLLKEEEKQKNIPIVMVTSRDDKEDISLGQEMGAEAYLIKPVDSIKLLETIGNLLG